MYYIEILLWENIKAMWDFELPAIWIGGEIVSIEVEFIDRPLYYKIYKDIRGFVAIVLTYFHMIRFPHKYEIVAIDHLTFFFSDSRVTGIFPLVGEAI